MRAANYYFYRLAKLIVVRQPYIIGYIICSLLSREKSWKPSIKRVCQILTKLMMGSVNCQVWLTEKKLYELFFDGFRKTFLSNQLKNWHTLIHMYASCVWIEALYLTLHYRIVTIKTDFYGPISSLFRHMMMMVSLEGSRGQISRCICLDKQ